MKVDIFDFDLPEDRIATRPVTPRDAGRLLYVSSLRSGGAQPHAERSAWPGRAVGEVSSQGQQAEPAVSLRNGALCERQQNITDKTVRDLPDLLQAGDVMVFNNTKVIPARLFGRRGEAKVEVTLHKRVASDEWRVARYHCFAKPGKKLKIGDTFSVADDFFAIVEDKLPSGEVVLRFNLGGGAFFEQLHKHGSMPLPPYMRRQGDADDEATYQTVYAKHAGAVAAPTAGLHFTPELLADLEAKGVKRVEVTLHVGAGTFLPVKVEDTEDHQMHAEEIIISQAEADAINAAKQSGGRVVAVGTTAMRVLESATDENGVVQPFAGETDIFITPGYRFRCVDVLMTNFHLPKSTLFMLVSAFSGLDTMQAAYSHAIDNGYRFYSYGDACLLERAT